MIELKPQPGYQEDILSCSADIAIGGGAAGVGKTYALLLEPVRHVHDRSFRAVFFRRTTPQITNQGGMWDTSFEIYPHVGGTPKSHILSWDFPSSCKFRMMHLEYEKDVHDHDGAQYTFIGFDQLEHFTYKQFFYMLSRLRSMSDVKPYVRATANPDPRSFLRQLIDWWIGKDGFPIKDRIGSVRWFAQEENRIIWVDRDWRSAEGLPPLSLTFIPGKLTDNQKLLEKNPQYAANLNAMARVDRLRLKDGNWNASEDDGLFETEWFKIVDGVPKGMRLIRYWDRAATEVSGENKDPDWTAGALCGMQDGTLYILDMQHFRGSPAANEKRIQRTAELDGKNVTVVLEQEPGSAGKDVIHHYSRRVLQGYTVLADRPTGSKVERAKPWCALAEKGYVCLKRGEWNYDFIKEAEVFPNAKRDQVDSVSGAYRSLATPQVTIYTSQMFEEKEEKERRELEERIDELQQR